MSASRSAENPGQQHSQFENSGQLSAENVNREPGSSQVPSFGKPDPKSQFFLSGPPSQNQQFSGNTLNVPSQFGASTNRSQFSGNQRSHQSQFAPKSKSQFAGVLSSQFAGGPSSSQFPVLKFP